MLSQHIVSQHSFLSYTCLHTVFILPSLKTHLLLPHLLTYHRLYPTITLFINTGRETRKRIDDDGDHFLSHLLFSKFWWRESFRPFFSAVHGNYGHNLVHSFMHSNIILHIIRSFVRSFNHSLIIMR